MEEHQTKKSFVLRPFQFVFHAPAQDEVFHLCLLSMLRSVSARHVVVRTGWTVEGGVCWN
ncbi:hypothetical protein BD289DRAFT_435273 [Coniella lustricola]|uniref:Uncharacterized protein n=1 Tax=Coniella lustricola TaxID=2025994 RepID=A0A2T3A6Q4_9PEZI|nr:hypothetical protein BD289DRAFT_435273 [Coniella lustricola]